jgi:hypothetical protein
MSESMSKADREQLYTDFLRTEGYLPELEKDEQVVFKKGNLTYVIVISEDADYFQIIVPPFWPIESEAERVQARMAAHVANAETKVAKVYFHEDDTWASVQMFCKPPESFKPVFGRCISVLEHAVETFVKQMKA